MRATFIRTIITACRFPDFLLQVEFRRRLAIVKFCVLSSGSSGNAAFLATDTTRLLIDAGLSLRDLARRLASIGERPEEIDAILITHEHCDHISGLVRMARRLGVRVYLTRLTAPLIDWENAWKDSPPRIELFQAGASFSIGDIEIDSFTIPHDAVDPVGYCLRAHGVKIGVVTDLGYIPESIKYHLRGVHALLMESNHDLDMLKVGPYPWAVKQRVMSRNGHLSNAVVGDYLLDDLDPSTETVILGHLSEHNNHPEIVRLTAAQALARRGLSPRLIIAEQKNPTEVLQF